MRKISDVKFKLTLFTILSITAFAFKVFAQDANTAQNLGSENKAQEQQNKIDNSANTTNNTNQNSNPTTATTEIKDSQIIDESNVSAISDILLNKNPKSLMFDEEQLDNINRAADSFTNNKAFVPNEAVSEELLDAKAQEEARLKAEEEKAQNEKSYLYLSSIMYLSPKNWVVWIGDQKITSKNNDKTKELSVESITNKHVKILWKLGISKWKIITGKRNDSDVPKTNDLNQIEVRFELKPNQTYVLNENKVVEGKAFFNSSTPPASNPNPNPAPNKSSDPNQAK